MTGILGVDYVTLTGRGGRDVTNGATVDSDDFMHLGNMLDRVTACKLPIKNFLATYSDVNITCKNCIAALKGE